MRPAKVGVGLRHGRHAQLVVAAREEAGERGRERDGAVATRRADRDADHVLLRDVTLDVALRIHVLSNRKVRKGHDWKLHETRHEGHSGQRFSC